MRILISHEHRESELAGAVHNLLTKLGGDRILPWYSSDTRPDGGMAAGQWWNILHEKIQQSDFVIAVLTRESMDRPWILWECGLATGQENTLGVIPVVFNIDKSELTGPLASFQAYDGMDFDDVFKMCAQLLTHIKLSIDADEVREDIEEFKSEVSTFFENDAMTRLFGAGFHKPDKGLVGEWEATWYNADGSIFEEDTFTVHMYDDKVRIIGQGAKGYAYPMEGRISANRYMSLTYWGETHLSVTGTVLLKIMPDGRKMKGNWSGHTTKDFEEDLGLVKGTVVCTKKA
ncbi:MAG: toll/interleukin-1 receptor domain-containing protein [Chloroflexota bacterium]